jgi:hypothetical protein
VKIQKPAIRKQVEWDLWCYRLLSGLAEKLFDMPSQYEVNENDHRPIANFDPLFSGLCVSQTDLAVRAGG